MYAPFQALSKRDLLWKKDVAPLPGAWLLTGMASRGYAPGSDVSPLPGEHPERVCHESQG